MQGWRTRLFAVVLGALGIVEQFYPDLVRQMIPPEYNGLAMMLIALAVYILREITTGPPAPLIRRKGGAK